MALVNLNLKPDNKTLRQFGLIALFAFGAMGAWAFFKGHLLFWAVPKTVAYVLFGLAGACGVLGLVAPQAVLPVYVGLTLLTFPIGFVVSHIILVGLYYVVLTPVGLLLRLFGKDPMQRKYEPDAPSYWEKREQVTDMKRYFQQF